MTTALFTDLDNTLIHSQQQSGDVPAERKDGRVVTWINAKAQALLDNEANTEVSIIPTTARSMAQYLRVDVFKAPPRYAITTMGAVVFADGKPCREWAARTRRIVAPTLDAMNDALERLCADERVAEARTVDGAFLFVYAVSEDAAVSMARKLRERYACFAVLQYKRKIYIVPKGIDKGSAAREVVRRLTAEVGKVNVAAAGDSVADVSFLADALRAFVPTDAMASAVREAAGDKNAPDITVCPAGVDFAAFILESVTPPPP